MTTATSTTHIPAAHKSGRVGGWFRRVFDGIVRAQMLVAHRRVMQELRNLDDSTLQRAGFSAKDIAILRAGGDVDFPS